MIYDDKSFQSGIIDNPEIFQRIADALPLPVFFRDMQGIVQSCNHAFALLTGLRKEELIGKTVLDSLPSELAGSISRHDQELFESLSEQSLETKIRYPDGSIHDVIVQKKVVFDKQDVAAGVVGSIVDITDRRKAEKKLEKAREASVIASAMLHKIRAGIIIVDSDFKVIDSNEGFAHLFGEEIEELYETIPGLHGADLKELVPEVVFKMFATLLATGENMMERDLKIQNKLLHVSVITIYKSRVLGALIRDMSAPSLVREEIISRAQRVNRQNLETVQKIAFLLGENASLTEELLNSIIESYKYGEDDN